MLSSTSPPTHRASAAARCPALPGVAAALPTLPGSLRGPGARGAPGTKTYPCRGKTPDPGLSNGLVLALSPACFAYFTKEPSFDQTRAWGTGYGLLACHPGSGPLLTSSISRPPRLSVSLSWLGLSFTTPHNCASKPASINESLHRYKRPRSGTRVGWGCLRWATSGHVRALRDPFCTYVSQSAALFAVIRPACLLGGYRVGSRRGIGQDGLCVSNPSAASWWGMGEK